MKDVPFGLSVFVFAIFIFVFIFVHNSDNGLEIRNIVFWENVFWTYKSIHVYFIFRWKQRSVYSKNLGTHTAFEVISRQTSLHDKPMGIKDLSAETLASAARLTGGRGGLQDIMQNKKVPHIVRDALNVMQVATSDVIGTDGHRRLCRHEGWAYMCLWGPPLIFATPNLADNKNHC